MSGAFVFRMQKVLDYRIQVEDQKSAAVRSAREVVLRCEDALERLRGMREAGYGSLSVPSSVAGHLKSLEFALDSLDISIDLAEAELVQALEALELARAQYREARAQREKLERIKEKHYSEWMLEQSRLDQKAMDELGRGRSRGSPS